jgi:hypothetical protein
MWPGASSVALLLGVLTALACCLWLVGRPVKAAVAARWLEWRQHKRGVRLDDDDDASPAPKTADAIELDSSLELKPSEQEETWEAVGVAPPAGSDSTVVAHGSDDEEEEATDERRAWKQDKRRSVERVAARRSEHNLLTGALCAEELD